MTSDRSDLFSKLEFGHNYQFNNSSETVLPIDRKDVSSQTTIATHTETSETGIIVALGFIATLLLFSGMQLYRSVNLNPASTKAPRFNRTFVFNTNNFNYNSLDEEIHFKRKTEMLIIKNTISQGKFY